MIHVIATIEVVDGQREAYLRELAANVPLVQAEQGCLAYQPTIDLATDIPAQGFVRDNVVTVVETWEDLEALKSHLVAPHMQAYRQRVRDLVVATTLSVLQPT